MTEIKIPIQFRITAVNKFTSQLFNQDAEPVSNSFVFDFEKLNFIDGSGYTVLSNSIAYLLHKGVKVAFRNHNKPKGRR